MPKEKQWSMTIKQLYLHRKLAYFDCKKDDFTKENYNPFPSLQKSLTYLQQSNNKSLTAKNLKLYHLCSIINWLFIILVFS